MDLHYPIAGIIVLVASVAFIKYLDYLAAQTVKRLLDMAGGLEKK